jgi:predicted lipid-binding transport protein (Tim44 family)
LQVLELLIFAVLAAVVLYQLYAVLGRRVGRQPEDKTDKPAAGAMSRGAPLDATVAQRLPADSPALGGMAAIKAKDQAFDVDKFLAGARSAFEVIVPAFAKGDRDALRPLLATPVYESFEAAITQRETETRSETIDFLQPPRADIEESVIEGDMARIKVRFLAEFRNRSKGPEGEAVDDRRTAEVWTFERPLASRDPNWVLARVEAAQA